jgi:hypothetical protein
VIIKIKNTIIVMDNLIITSMGLYLVLSYLIPIIFKKSTNVKPIDDLVLYIISQRGMMMYGVIYIGLIVHIAMKISSQSFE